MVAIDMPGHGRSQHLPAFCGNYTAECYIRICTALLGRSPARVSQPFNSFIFEILGRAARVSCAHSAYRAQVQTPGCNFSEHCGANGMYIHACHCYDVTIALFQQGSFMLARSMGAGIAQMLATVSAPAQLLLCLCRSWKHLVLKTLVGSAQSHRAISFDRGHRPQNRHEARQFGCRYAQKVMLHRQAWSMH